MAVVGRLDISVSIEWYGIRDGWKYGLWYVPFPVSSAYMSRNRCVYTLAGPGGFTVRATVVVRVRPPPTPVMVTVAAPSVALAAAVRVSVLLLPVVGSGLNVAVTPVGTPLALRSTLAVKLVRAMPIVLVPAVPPCVMVTAPGVAESSKFWAGFTVRVTVVVRVRPPPVPVMVTGNVPVAAVAEAVNVATLLLPVVGSGLNVAVTPVGSPLALRSTLAVKLVRVIPIVLVPAAPPCVIVTAGGVADSVKFCAGFTVRVTVVVRVRPPPVPVMVTGNVPVVAVAEAVNVATLLLPVVGSGLNVAVTPAGTPLALRSTLAVKLVRAMPIVLVPAAPPCVTVTVGGVADSVKFCAGFTVRVTVVVRVRPPPVPVMVTGNVPVVAVAEAVNVATLLLPVVGSGLNVAVTPAGTPLALRSTLAVKLVRAMPIVLVPAAPPCVIVTVGGVADSVKFCAGFTVRVTVVVRVRPPPVPVMVTGNVPVVAVAEAVNVATLLLPVVGSGLNVAVTPAGTPLALRSTLAVKLVRAMPIVLVPAAPPCGDGERGRSGGQREVLRRVHGEGHRGRTGEAAAPCP